MMIMPVKLQQKYTVFLTVLLLFYYTSMHAKQIVELFRDVYVSKNLKYAVLFIPKNRGVHEFYINTYKLCGFDTTVAKYNRIFLFTLTQDSSYCFNWSAMTPHKNPPWDIYVFNNGRFVMTFGSMALTQHGFVAIHDSTGAVCRKYEKKDIFPRHRQCNSDTMVVGYIKKYDIDEDSMRLIYIADVLISDAGKKKLSEDTLTLDLNTGDLLRDR